jgi:DNA-binding MarR family transcriptional regulator
MNKTLAIVQEWVSFEGQNPNGDIEDFCRQYLKKKEAADIAGHSNDNEPDEACRFDLSRVINRLSRLWMYFTMTEMKQLGLTSFDEFVFLLTVERVGSVRKKDLIYLHFIEISSGILIIDRLIKKSFLDEKIDETDKRSKNVNITKKGRKVLTAGHVILNKVHSDLYGELNTESVLSCLELLNSLLYTMSDKWNKEKKFDPTNFQPIFK